MTAIDDADRKTGSRPARLIFKAACPRILGALLDALAVGLRRLPEVGLDRLPRMADFAKWATACEHGAFADGAFMAAYTGNRAEAVESVIDASPVASAIRALMESDVSWEGTAADLHSRLSEIAGDSCGEVQGVAVECAGAEPQLEPLEFGAAASPGLYVERERTGSRRLIRISAGDLFTGPENSHELASFASSRHCEAATNVTQTVDDDANDANPQKLPVPETALERVPPPPQPPGTERLGDAYRRVRDGK